MFIPIFESYSLGGPNYTSQLVSHPATDVFVCIFHSPYRVIIYWILMPEKNHKIYKSKNSI